MGSRDGELPRLPARAHAIRAHCDCGDMGDPRCPCLSSLESFGIPADTNLTPNVDGNVMNYGPLYGLQSCQAHDLHRPPSCVGLPSKACVEQRAQGAETATFKLYCLQYWCFVNISSCLTLRANQSSYNWSHTALQDPRNELAYSYATCNSCDSFTGSNLGEAASQESSGWIAAMTIIVAASRNRSGQIGNIVPTDIFAMARLHRSVAGLRRFRRFP